MTMFRNLMVVLAVLLGPASVWAQDKAGSQAPVILMWGDSLGASYGVPVQQGWVTLMQQRLRDQGYPQRVVNASISGETTAGGLARLPAALQVNAPKIVMIELGANDGLRGLKLDLMRKNLQAMIEQARKAGAQVLLFEMQIPPSYGPEYTGRFAAVFGDLAKQEHVPLVPFFLMPLTGDLGRWLQDDGLHPTAEAQPLLLDAVWPSLQKLLGKKPS